MDDLLSYKFIRKFQNTNWSVAKTSNSLSLAKPFLHSFISLLLIMWCHVFMPLTYCNNFSEDLKKAFNKGLQLYLKRDSNTGVFRGVCEIFNNTFLKSTSGLFCLCAHGNVKLHVKFVHLNSEVFVCL